MHHYRPLDACPAAEAAHLSTEAALHQRALPDQTRRTVHTGAVDDLPRDDLLAATPEVAARLAGVTVRQVNYWREIGLIEPAVARRISPRNEVRLYDFTGLVELRIVGALRNRLSLQHIRQVINRLRASYDRPLTELRFAVQDRNLYFQHPGGTWEGGQRPGQIVLAEVIMLEEVRAELRRAAAERSREPGRVVKRRRVHGSKPTFAGTRIPLSAVEAFLRQGASDEDILAGSRPDGGRGDRGATRASHRLATRWEWGESTRDYQSILVHQVVHELMPEPRRQTCRS